MAAEVRGEVGVPIPKLDCIGCGAAKGDKGPNGVLKLSEVEKGD